MNEMDTAEKVSFGFFLLSVIGFFTLLFLSTLNLVEQGFIDSAFQFLIATGGYAVFGKTANVFAESRRDRYRGREERD